MKLKDRVWIGFTALAGWSVAVKAGLLRPLDRDVTALVVEQHNEVRDAVARFVTFFGSSTWFLAVLALLIAYWVRRNRTDRLKVFLCGWLGGLGIQWLLRLTVAQWRPDTGVLPDPLSFWQRYDLAGYTTGHGFRAAFLFGWFFRESLKAGRSWSVPAATLSMAVLISVGLTRIYLQRHWLTDVVGAWLLAFSVFSAIAWYEATSATRSASERERHGTRI